jgi:hypothetical protein
MKTVEIIMTCLALAGAIEISYVESSIISKSVSRQVKETSLLDIYWYDLSKKDRWLFWTGFIFLFSPFILPIIL